MANMLFDSNGRPTEALLQVLSICGVDHDGTLVGIRNSTQSIWYVGPGIMRSDIAETHAHLKTPLMPHFMRLGLIDPIRARSFNYDKALLLGATIVAVRKRLAFLGQEWERGVRFKEIDLIGSGRTLNEKDPPDLLKFKNPELPFDDTWVNEAEVPTTEGQMMRLVYDQAQSRFPWKGQVKVVFCIHPGKANTEETVQHWLADAKPVPGKCLAVSSQPFVGYQELTVRKVLPDSFEVEAIGYGAPPSITISAFLDNLAKAIYELAG